MDYYKKKVVRNIVLAILFAIGVVLQFYGHRIESYLGLGIQFISLTLLILVLYLYNRRFS